MKNVLIISASPRQHGNSDILCNEFSKGAKEKGHDVEIVTLRDKEIQYCLGCYACEKTNQCFQQDDMKFIIEKMIEADVIVLATPVYFYSMAGQLKTMIDRTLPRYEELQNKEMYFIATAADDKSAMETTIDSMKGFSDCLPEASVKGVIYGEHAWQKGDVLDNKAMLDAYLMGTSV